MRQLQLISLLSVGGLSAASVIILGTPTRAASASHQHIDCAATATLCTEVQDSEEVFGQGVYVGHDEPSLLFYSNTAGAGNSMTWKTTLPQDPISTGVYTGGDPRSSGQSFNFQLQPAFWFGMAMCDDQSYPESQWTFPNAGTTCIPGSDTNITSNAGSAQAHHAGTAFMEMQFYPPGWAEWPPGVSCSKTQWCAALNIDSLSEDPVTGQVLNSTCAARTGLEYVNFAFLTYSGTSKAPANPVDATAETFNPTDSTDVAFYNSGDQLSVSLGDTPNGLNIAIDDVTQGRSSSMTAGATNGFGMVQFAPTGSTCANIPYNFHPEYSTSEEQSQSPTGTMGTRVPWAAHAYNIAFDSEIGHFDYCGNVGPHGTCSKNEGIGGDIEPSDKDDTVCFPSGALGALVTTSGCIGINGGFDGLAYLNDWPDGSSKHPAPDFFSSPLINGTTNYSNAAFEADMPRVEVSDVSTSNHCDRTTGAGCVNPPLTDDRASATFYPFYSTAQSGSGGSCDGWIFGNDIGASPQDGSPEYTLNDYGKNLQYGPLYQSTFLNVPSGPSFSTRTIYESFQNYLNTNPCPAATP